MATASISLIREQSEAVKPPRALWVPFALGRPLGAADDAEFQKRVMRAALGMLSSFHADLAANAGRRGEFDIEVESIEDS